MPQERNVIFFPMGGHFVLIRHHLVAKKGTNTFQIKGETFKFIEVVFRGSNVVLEEKRKHDGQEVAHQVCRRFWLASIDDTNCVLPHLGFMGELNYVEDVLARFHADTDVRRLIKKAHDFVSALHRERMFV